MNEKREKQSTVERESRASELATFAKIESQNRIGNRRRGVARS
jgi:hypothetical protein